ncbi:MAG: 6-carboxytetrahydropterin synthase QueD [Candidatus Kerfeldbacteria bacterium]|nr:6-carboxytetrahydropterin synthase QueD [Candidatus Kerfeldbacteria bacterium]
MPFNVTKEFTFAAAHFLTKYHGKCEQLHGHNYRLHVTVTGSLNADDLVVDFVELKAIVKAHVIDQLDHTNLNDKFPNPTCELLAQWIFEQLKPVCAVSSVQLWETDTSSVSYHE